MTWPSNGPAITLPDRDAPRAVAHAGAPTGWSVTGMTHARVSTPQGPSVGNADGTIHQVTPPAPLATRAASGAIRPPSSAPASEAGGAAPARALSAGTAARRRGSTVVAHAGASRWPELAG